MAQKTTVLIAEGGRDMRSLLCDELWGTGYQLCEAQDGDEAFRTVLDSPPDVVLTDFRMPAGGVDRRSGLYLAIAHRCPTLSHYSHDGFRRGEGAGRGDACRSERLF